MTVINTPARRLVEAFGERKKYMVWFELAYLHGELVNGAQVTGGVGC